jgi:hypothetical protein
MEAELATGAAYPHLRGARAELQTVTEEQVISGGSSSLW